MFGSSLADTVYWSGITVVRSADFDFNSVYRDVSMIVS